MSKKILSLLNTAYIFQYDKYSDSIRRFLFLNLYVNGQFLKKQH